MTTDKDEASSAPEKYLDQTHAHPKRLYRCSFCSKSQDQVQRLIAGPAGVYICDECIDLCKEIFREEGVAWTLEQDESTSVQQQTTEYEAPSELFYKCSFCPKLQGQVQRLFAGPGGVYICNECIGLCEQIIEEEAQERKKQDQS